MRIIKLSAIDSTNSYLKQLYHSEKLDDYTVVITQNQTKGRGQMGTVWASQSHQNLTFSVFKEVSWLSLNDSFFISMAVALSVVKAIKKHAVPHLSIKWPNDILSEKKKICGVLIENVIKQNVMTASVIGIGLNVNQTEFEGLPQASSLKLICGKTFNTDEIAMEIIQHLKLYVALLEDGNLEKVKEEYESYLFRKNKPSTFKDAEGRMFSGIIQGVSRSGSLRVLLEENQISEFNLKEVTLLY